MRNLFLTKWIQELNKEIEKSKKEQNLRKTAELQWLKDELVKLWDRPD